MMAKIPASVPQHPRGEGGGCSQGTSGLCQKEEEAHPSEEKRHLSQRKMVALGEMSYLMKLTNGKGNKLLSLLMLEKQCLCLEEIVMIYNYSCHLLMGTVFL